MKMIRKKVLSFLLVFTFVLSGLVMMPTTKTWAFQARTTHPSVQGVYYNTGNPFPAKGANCTWYAFGRIYEINGTRPNVSMGHAKDWWGHNIYLQSIGQGYSYGTDARVGDIACWGGGYGHVAVVEKIDSNGIIWISESNYNQNRLIIDLLAIMVGDCHFKALFMPEMSATVLIILLLRKRILLISVIAFMLILKIKKPVGI